MGKQIYRVHAVISHDHLLHMQHKQLKREVTWSAFALSPVALVQVLPLDEPRLTPVSPGQIVSVFVPSMRRSLSNV